MLCPSYPHPTLCTRAPKKLYKYTHTHTLKPIIYSSPTVAKEVMTANHIYLQAKRAEGLTLPLCLQMAEGPDVIVHIQS